MNSAICEKARKETLKYFGKTISLYAPLYISNECCNGCTYCGFNAKSKIKRSTLTLDQVMAEAKALKKEGFQHILLLTGEAPAKVPIEFIAEIVKKLKVLFVSISIEIYPLSVEDYRLLIDAGVDGLTIYQETYHLATYKKVHPVGPKSDYGWRYAAPERAAKAGMRKIGVGFLLGLYDWRYEATKLAEHIEYLQKNYWQTQIQISFPRLNPAETKFKVEFPVSDADFIEMVCAFRIKFPQIGFTLSTREKASFRDKIFPYGFTQMSAGSKTNPGGYSLGEKSGKQFEIADARSPKQVTAALIKAGYEPVWKDWDRDFR
ncbi:MAG: 2-iminoacetate synthase ThiH [Candidatus Margulisiibacteriota bacterium]